MAYAIIIDNEKEPPLIALAPQVAAKTAAKTPKHRPGRAKMGKKPQNEAKNALFALSFAVDLKKITIFAPQNRARRLTSFGFESEK